MLIKRPTLIEIVDYDCIFFDFDGIVLESADIKTEAFIELYQGLGIEDEVRKHHLDNQGISRFEKFRWISENLLHETYTEEKGEELGELFSGLVRAKVIASPFVSGFEELIKNIRNQNIHCVVASGTPQPELEMIISERGIGKYFDEIHGSPKSKEAIVNEVLVRKKFQKEQCLFLGDASTDHQAAEVTEIDFYARLTPELAEYWQKSIYTFGTFDFEDVR